ncbi:hypothetical protein DAI22_12g071825 [Oryza sativa Japonica Group]|nr:hypothetical protein DAI22_12g071825 [Oryza sativa Japonica Group]
MAGGWTSTASRGGGGGGRQLVVPVLLLVLTLLMVMASAAGRGANVSNMCVPRPSPEGCPIPPCGSSTHVPCPPP